MLIFSRNSTAVFELTIYPAALKANSAISIDINFSISLLAVTQILVDT